MVEARRAWVAVLPEDLLRTEDSVMGSAQRHTADHLDEIERPCVSPSTSLGGTLTLWTAGG